MKPGSPTSSSIRNWSTSNGVNYSVQACSASGQLQKEGEVVHLIARRLVDLSAWLGPLQTSSRDFH